MPLTRVMINYNCVNKEMKLETVSHVMIIIHPAYNWINIYLHTQHMKVQDFQNVALFYSSILLLVSCY
jgi:hypothetical protein